MYRYVSELNVIKIYSLLLLMLFVPLLSHSQSAINGTITDSKKKPVPYAVVFIKNSKDGTSTDAEGKFTLQTKLKGQQTFLISLVGYETLTYDLNLEDKTYPVDFIMKESSVSLGEVTISAGMIEAKNDRVVSVLKPLDIVTTAGGQGDIIGAIQTLPGVQRNGGDQTGLMVRGGDVNESMIIIDGTTAQNAFGSSIPGVAQRSRFNPFQFKGTSFSSGGYSAKYGQALSSVLDLQTNDLPEKSTVNIGASFAGVSLSGSKLMDNNAIEYSANYNNLTPYYSLAKTNISFYDIPQAGGFSTRWVSKVSDKGMFKMSFQQSFSSTGIVIPDPQKLGNKINFGLENENTFFNTSYTEWLTSKLKFFSAFAFSNNTDQINWGTVNAYRHDDRVQGRAEINYQPNRKINLLIGAEVQHYNYQQQYDTLKGLFGETLAAFYVENEWKPISWFGLKTGVRCEYSELLQKGNIVPRISAAVKTSVYGQVSAASGIFYQSPSTNYLLEGYRPGFQQAIHYMLNYQWMRDDRTFRVEGYYKSYNQLLRETGIAYNPNQYRFYFGQVDNSGSGYAQGIDFFWRDKKTIRNFDYWISYSFIDTKRLYQNYLAKVTPDYVSPNNLNIITKYFIDKIQTNISVSYNYASGRAYYNPASPVFLSDKAPDYHNLALSLSYLFTIKNMFAVCYVSFDNITNQHNILGYRYSNDGQYRYPVLPPVYRSIFIGINISLSEFKKDELL